MSGEIKPVTMTFITFTEITYFRPYSPPMKFLRRPYISTILLLILSLSAIFFMTDIESVSESRRIAFLVNLVGPEAATWIMRAFFALISVGLVWILHDEKKTTHTIDRIAHQRQQIDNSIRREK
ncbi:MAG: hypothetical protein QM645_10155 [Asticcacaulis sp.]